jgi:hypothetical protein
MFSRADVLGGMPARRAGTLLFAIESRTGQLVARSRVAMATYLTEQAEVERERAVRAALADGREGAARVNIQDLERSPASGPRWSARRRPGATADCRAAPLPGGRRARPADALGLDDDAVTAAFGRGSVDRRVDVRPRHPVGTASLVAIAGPGQVEGLPPFWIAYA